MAGGKQTPRQQMIGIMYLVLLAMLAMNASKDLLNAFVMLEKGIDVTTDNFSNTNKTVYDKITQAAATKSEVAILVDKNAQKIKEKSNEIFQLIDTHKKAIIELGGGVDEDTQVPVGKDNQDVGAEYLITKGNGKSLKEKIGAYRDFLKDLIHPSDTMMIHAVEQLLETPKHVDYEGVVSPWENGISEYLPLAAVTANLTNIQSYVRNAESQVLSYLYENIGVDAYKVNKIQATSIAKSGYILQGEDYSANIFLAASDTTQEPIIIAGKIDTAYYYKTGEVKFTGTKDTIPVKGGMGQYKINNDQLGNHTWGGVMKVPHPNPKRRGEYLTYPFLNNYTVAAPSAVISSDQLNIMYLKLNNEISVSASGVNAEDLIVTANNGCSVRKISSGKYIFTPSRAGKVTITVSTKIKGESKILSTQDWKSKRLPAPLLKIPGLNGNSMNGRTLANVLMAVGAKPKYDPAFPISAIPQIRVSKLSVKNSNGLTDVNLNNGKIENTRDKALISSLRRGDKVYVDMKAVGPDGIPHDISTTINIR